MFYNYCSTLMSKYKNFDVKAYALSSIYHSTWNAKIRRQAFFNRTSNTAARGQKPPAEPNPVVSRGRKTG